MEDFLVPYPWLFPAFIVFMWFFVLSLVAKLGGWTELADHYRADAEFIGPSLRFQTVALERIAMMPMGLNNILTIGADPMSLHLSMFFLFRPGHPPLSIPWSEIETAPRKILFVHRVELRTQRAPKLKLLINPKQAAFLAEGSGGQFNVPDPTGAAA